MTPHLLSYYDLIKAADRANYTGERVALTAQAVRDLAEYIRELEGMLEEEKVRKMRGEK